MAEQSKKGQAGKLFLKLFIFAVPFICIALVFVMFEPYDYWGIFKDNRGYFAVTPVPRMRGFMHSDATAVMIGDSRTEHLDMNDISAASEFTVLNLASGGQSLRESIDMFWFAVGERKLETVYFELSFYTMNLKYDHARMAEAIELATSTVSYITFKDTQNNVKIGLMEYLLPTLVEPETVEAGEVKSKEQSMLDYAALINSVCTDYVLNETAIERLKDVAVYCKENDIKLVFYVPPCHSTIWENVIEPLSLEDEMDMYKRELSFYADIYDMEYISAITENDAAFRDGFHFEGEVLEEYIAAICTGEGENLRVWRNGEIIVQG